MEEKQNNFMKKGSKSGLSKTFGPILGFYTNKPERVFGLQVLCRELDIFKIIECFEFFGEFFGRIFLGGFFWKDFFGGDFFGGIFWNDFLGGFFWRIFLGGILWEVLLSRFLQGIDVFVKILG